MEPWELTDDESYHAEGEGFDEWVGHGEPPHMQANLERRAIAHAAQKKLVEWMDDQGAPVVTRWNEHKHGVLIDIEVLKFQMRIDGKVWRSLKSKLGVK
jgi:hypothetical protein